MPWPFSPQVGFCASVQAMPRAIRRTKLRASVSVFSPRVRRDRGLKRPNQSSSRLVEADTLGFPWLRTRSCQRSTRCPAGGHRLHVPPQGGDAHPAAQQGQEAGQAPETDTVHVQVGHQLPEGLWPLAGSHVGRQGRGASPALSVAHLGVTLGGGKGCASGPGQNESKGDMLGVCRISLFVRWQSDSVRINHAIIRLEPRGPRMGFRLQVV